MSTTVEQYTNDYNALVSAVKVAKTAINPHYKNAYAPLDAWLDAVHELLPKYNFCLTEKTTYLNCEHGLYLLHEYELTHKSGASINSVYPMCSVDEKPQAIGSALTYARRYHIQVILNATGETDDDGNQAQATVTAVKREPVAMKRKLA